MPSTSCLFKIDSEKRSLVEVFMLHPRSCYSTTCWAPSTTPCPSSSARTWRSAASWTTSTPSCSCSTRSATAGELGLGVPVAGAGRTPLASVLLLFTLLPVQSSYKPTHTAYPAFSPAPHSAGLRLEGQKLRLASQFFFICPESRRLTVLCGV